MTTNSPENRGFSGLARRVGGKGANAWEIHRQALERRARGEDILILSIGEDVAARTPDHIVEAGIDSIRAGRHHYTAIEGESRLREAIAARHSRRTGRTVGPDRCCIYSGAQNALFATAITLLDPSDDVIVIEPYYSTYPATFSASGARLVTVVAEQENGFAPRIEDIEAAMTPATKLLVINSPSNPAGAVYPEPLIREIAELCRDRDVWLLSDEVYADFVFDGRHVSPASVMEADEKLVVVSSLSKSHRMSGWRIGWAIGPDDFSLALADLSLCMQYGLPAFTQDAAVAALAGPQEETSRMVAEYGERAAVVHDRLANTAGLTATRPSAGMFVILDVSAIVEDAHDFCQRLLDDTGIAVLPCGGFGDRSGHLVRMSLCAERSELERACAAISGLSARMHNGRAAS